MRIDASLRTDAGELVVVVAGDVDASATEQLREVVTMGLELVERTVVRLDGVTVFGSAASRVLRDLLASADVRGSDLRIEGVPRHVVEVLEIVGLHDDRISHVGNSLTPLSPAIFDAVIASGAMRTREAVCITTPDPDDPRILFVNDAFTSLTGYRADEILGKSPKIMQGALTERAVLDRLKRCLYENRDFSGEVVNYRSDGSPFWMNWRVLAIDYGSHRYFMAMQRDGTRMRQLSRLDAARNLLTRAINATDASVSRDTILEALSSATIASLAPPEAAVSTALTTVDGTVIAANLEGNFTDAGLFTETQTAIHERDGSVTVHVPFRVSAELRGHLLLQHLHPDWVQLLDIGHLTQLCDDCTHALLTAME